MPWQADEARKAISGLGPDEAGAKLDAVRAYALTDSGRGRQDRGDGLLLGRARSYEGAGHRFLRAQADRGGANYRASEQAWPRVLAFLARHTR